MVLFTCIVAIGIWIPSGIGSVIKFSKYLPGSKFLPHMDNVNVVNRDERSIFTLIIYLNNDFTGGSTYFHKRNEKQLPFVPQDLEATRIGQVVPKTGNCLLFNHDVLHEGAQIETGNKYIIRVELMYQRISKSHAHLFKFTRNNPEVMLAHHLYNEADKLIMQGDTKKATEKYLKGLSMFVESPSVELQLGLTALPGEMFVTIFSFLDWKDLLLSCAAVNKK